MPLRVRQRKGTAFLWLVGTIEGRRIRETTGTTDAKLAEIKRAAREAELFKAAVAGERPSVPFAKAVASYLKSENPGHTQRFVIGRLEKVLGRMLLSKIDQEACDRARDALCKADAAGSTVARNVVAPLTSILRHGHRRGWCQWPRLEWPQKEETIFNFFTPAQAFALVHAAATHLQPLLLFMLCTGVRIGEALTLEWDQVDLQGRTVILREGTTKTGKRRVIHLNPGALAALSRYESREGRVFRRDDGEPYDYSPGAVGNIRSAWATACFRAGLPGDAIVPKGGKRGKARTFKPLHTPHDCRHSYASWHYCLHKDLLLLARDVGWASTKMAERYAHVMPVGNRYGICEFWGVPDPEGAILAQRSSTAA